ncbi:hypothetical protein Tco_1493924 [Tanacetum coccineum]
MDETQQAAALTLSSQPAQKSVPHHDIEEVETKAQAEAHGTGRAPKADSGDHGNERVCVDKVAIKCATMKRFGRKRLLKHVGSCILLVCGLSSRSSADYNAI